MLFLRKTISFFKKRCLDLVEELALGRDERDHLRKECEKAYAGDYFY